MSWFKGLFKQPETPRGTSLKIRVDALVESANRVEESREREETLNRELRRAYYHIVGHERRMHTVPQVEERRHDGD